MGRVIALKEEEKILMKEEDVTKATLKNESLTTYLNTVYSKQVEEFNKNHRDADLDAFDIALLSHGIVVKDDLKFGIESSTMDKFFTTNENRFLFQEFIIRQLRQITTTPSILNYLVASTRVIRGDGARQVVLDLTEDTADGKSNRKALKRRRIAEGAEIPVAELKLGETAIKIYKYGIGVRATYEVLRRTTVDMFRKQMELVSLQAAYDEVSEVINVVLNGDGNTNAAKVYQAKQLNPSATEGVIDEDTLIKFLIEQDYLTYDTLIVDKEIYTQICTTLLDKNLTNGINPQVTFIFPQGLLKPITVVLYKEMPLTSDNKHQIIGLAKDYAIQKTIEANSIIQEVTKVSTNQTQVAVMTENAGFNKIDSRASAILVLK